jgi:hypothetical protein
MDGKLAHTEVAWTKILAWTKVFESDFCEFFGRLACMQF